MHSIVLRNYVMIIVLLSVSIFHLPAAFAMAKRPPLEPKMPVVTVQAPASEIPVFKLSDLIEEALRANPEIDTFKERWKAGKARVWREMSWDDTMIGADFEGIPRGTADAGKNSDIEWMISQKIPFPGKRFLKGRVAAKEAKMREADYRAKEREIVSEVKKAYYDYFLKEHEAGLHEGTKTILEKLAQSAESRYATGQTSYQEVLKIHTELAVMTNEVAKHYQERAVALARLNALLGRDPREPLKIAIAMPDRELSFSKEELMELALEKRPELRAMTYGVEAAKTDVKSAWMDLLPDAQIRLEARKYSGEGRIREYDQFYGFEVPVFSMLGRVGKIKEKRAEKRAADGAWKNMKNMVLFEIEKMLAEFESNGRTVKVYETSAIPQAESAFKSALAEYEAGRGDFFKMMEAQKTLTEFRHHYIEALVMREQSFADLERAVGVNLEGRNPMVSTHSLDHDDPVSVGGIPQ